MDLPGYDAWKLATPPEYEGPECPNCGEPVDRPDEVCGDCAAEIESQEMSFERELRQMPEDDHGPLDLDDDLLPVARATEREKET